jgi:hypothetical protein
MPRELIEPREGGTVRADGRKIHPMYLVEVKKPAESKGATSIPRSNSLASL